MHDSLERTAIFLASLALFIGVATYADAAPPQVTFERHEIDLGVAPRATVLTGFLLGGAPARIADLAVVHVDEKGDRRLRIYAFGRDDERGEDRWSPQLDATLRPGVLFVDVASIGGRDRLVTYEPGRFHWFDPDSATERRLLEVAARYRTIYREEVPHVDLTRDLNGDGRDDLVVPDVDGFWISTQTSDGSLTHAVKLGPPEPFARSRVGGLDLGETGLDGSATYGEVGITAATIPLYLSRVHAIDYDQDGLRDLVFWNEDHFEVYTQEKLGRFDTEAETFATDVPFDAAGVYSRAFAYTDQGPLSLLFGIGEKTEGTVLHSMGDLNGDGVADLVTLTLAGRSITKQRSIYKVHFGSSKSGGIKFAREAGATIRPKGKAGGMQPWGYVSLRFEDLDRDGQVDMLYQTVAVGPGGMMRTLVGKSVPLNLEVYRMEGGTYPDRPTVRRKFRRFAPFAGFSHIFFPVVLMGDVNRDGRSDLLVGKSPDELELFAGVPGPGLFAGRPQKIAIALPHHERNTRVVDLNRDGKDDLLVHHRPTAHAPTEPHRVMLLVAR